jgi:hypothetical protein
MAHFAKVENGIVTNVIVAESEFFDKFIDNSPGEWIQTSYNTRGGVHLNGETPLRYNYAGLGYIYDKEADAFYEPQPYPSWTLNTETYLWEPPVPHPTGAERYVWNEENQFWEEVNDN